MATVQVPTCEERLLSFPVTGMQASFPTGQRLICAECGSQIQINRSCSAQPSYQVLKCCGKDMRPAP